MNLKERICHTYKKHGIELVHGEICSLYEGVGTLTEEIAKSINGWRVKFLATGVNGTFEFYLKKYGYEWELDVFKNGDGQAYQHIEDIEVIEAIFDKKLRELNDTEGKYYAVIQKAISSWDYEYVPCKICGVASYDECMEYIDSHTADPECKFVIRPIMGLYMDQKVML